jgi:hypothetical protein
VGGPVGGRPGARASWAPLNPALLQNLNDIFGDEFANELPSCDRVHVQGRHARCLGEAVGIPVYNKIEFMTEAHKLKKEFLWPLIIII